ncbi:MAG: hypothetical protein V3V40_04180 [Nitrosomonadaceae bacterium]
MTPAHADIVVENISTGFYDVQIINTITESDYKSLAINILQHVAIN